MTRDQAGAGRAVPTGRDWFFVEVFEWMWRDDGLGLRPGAELMVYATIYRASAHGGGAFVATNASMGLVLGYPRETISRAVGKLLKAGLVWVVGHIHDGHGGKAVKCYAVRQAAIDRVQGRIPAHHLLGYLSPTDAIIPTGEVAEGGKAAEEERPEGNVTFRHIGGQASEGTSQQSVTKRHAKRSDRDEASRTERDASSHVTERHIAKNGPPPANTTLFDMPLINTCYLLPNKGAAGHVENPEEGTPEESEGMDPNDLLAFRSLVDRSVRPVDPGYLKQNLREFRALLAEGIPAEVILEAYDGYAEFQAQMMAEHGENRPLHLLHWLRQRPNNNIQYVLNAHDGEWQRQQRARKAARPTHGDPELTRCRDAQGVLWFAADERGGRIVEGSRGVESPTRARELYERMYERERRP